MSGSYTIAATEINDLTNVKLEDTKTGIITSLAEKSYTFNWEAGEDEHRFILRFAAVGTPEPEEAVSSIYSYDKTAVIDLPGNVRGDVYVYNLAGQPVAAKESVTGQIRINLSPTGVYVVKVVTGKQTLTKKVWIR
ncbi:MAG TPA: T9SS type A sorting domain-containing protein, partial [Bacteroidales bacterium]|nr:T9SS type A sorting domain-containing protein [Bacteroidales bacterium]